MLNLCAVSHHKDIKTSIYNAVSVSLEVLCSSVLITIKEIKLINSRYRRDSRLLATISHPHYICVLN